MSIRPIDQTTFITKTQEMSNQKQSEISKGENIVYNATINREKEIIDSQQKVIDTKKLEYNKIGQEESKEKSKYSGEKKENQDSESKDKKKDINNEIVGSRIDIRI